MDEDDNFTRDFDFTKADPTKADPTFSDDSLYEHSTEKVNPPRELFDEEDTKKALGTDLSEYFHMDNSHPDLFLLRIPKPSENNYTVAIFALQRDLLEYLSSKLPKDKAYLPLLANIQGAALLTPRAACMRLYNLSSMLQGFTVTDDLNTAKLRMQKEGLNSAYIVSQVANPNSFLKKIPAKSIKLPGEKKSEYFGGDDNIFRARFFEQFLYDKRMYEAQKRGLAKRIAAQGEEKQLRLHREKERRKKLLPKKRGIFSGSSSKEPDFYLTKLRVDSDKYSSSIPIGDVYLLFPLSKDLILAETSIWARLRRFSAFSGPLLFSSTGKYRLRNSLKEVEIGTLKDLARIEGIEKHKVKFSFETYIKFADQRLNRQKLGKYFNRLRMYILSSKEVGTRFRGKKAITMLIPRYQLVLQKRLIAQGIVGAIEKKKPVRSHKKPLATVYPLPGQTISAAKNMRREDSDMGIAAK
ncbi:hypothetical protein HOC01_01955 [archaeon]|mgnify:CR=1 FL=1|jgi:hypothetical protein|nr:hypothetical protein [archaeon]MBT6697915.1 hypothetical protein [archaeon]